MEERRGLGASSKPEGVCRQEENNNNKKKNPPHTRSVREDSTSDYICKMSHCGLSVCGRAYGSCFWREGKCCSGSKSMFHAFSTNEKCDLQNVDLTITTLTINKELNMFKYQLMAGPLC